MRVPAPVPPVAHDPRFTLARARERLAAHAPNGRPVPEGARQAAVLLLLRDGPHGLEVLLTRRSHDVRDHKGQVSLPGGGVEPGDADSLAAALRESAEEVGLAPGRARVLGRLDDFLAITSYHVATWAAEVDSFEGLSPRTGEIEEVFPFPMAYLADERHVLRLPWRRHGVAEDVLFVPYGDQLLWGLTARMLWHFLEVLS
jgi:8-oxo-dGTP pyrophosphatase MutT (NUDIX family)